MSDPIAAPLPGFGTGWLEREENDPRAVAAPAPPEGVPTAYQKGYPHGPLLVSGGSAVGVATDGVLALGSCLRTLAADLGALGRAVAGAPPVAGAWCKTAPPEVLDGHPVAVDGRAEELASALSRTAHRAAALHGSLVDAALAYERAEEAARRQQLASAAATAHELGAHLPLLAALALTSGAWAYLGWVLAPGSEAEKRKAVTAWLLAHPELETNPGFVDAVRGFAASVDDGVAGATGIPASALDGKDGRAGGYGVEFGATTVLALGSLIGLFSESAVRVRRVSTEPLAAPPATLAERLDRVPQDDDDDMPDPQVRIERYSAPGRQDRWMVYVDPTETFSPLRSGEPWDLTSNVDGVGDRTAASYRATEAAMRDAGVAPSDPVQFVGYSQGGLVAGMLAASGHWRAAGLDTIAAPVGNIPLPAGLPGMNVRHSDDLVPALAGPDVYRDGRTTVEQRAFPQEIPTGRAVPAHQRASYEETVAAVDASPSPEVRAELERMRRFTADQAARPGATATVFVYRAERTGADRPAWLEPEAPRPFRGEALPR